MIFMPFAWHWQNCYPERVLSLTFCCPAAALEDRESEIGYIWGTEQRVSLYVEVLSGPGLYVADAYPLSRVPGLLALLELVLDQ